MAEQMLSGSGFWQPLLGMVLAALAVMGSPGPATMSVTAAGAAFGLRRSLGYMAGVSLGTAAVLAAVAAGVMALLLSLPGVAPVLTTVSAIYILYLAWRIATAPPLAQRSADAPAPSLAAGFLLAVANPKAYFAIASVFTGSTLAVQSPALEALLKVAVLGAMIFLIHAAWLLAGASLTGLLRDPVRSRIANLLFAAILVATAFLALPP